MDDGLLMDREFLVDRSNSSAILFFFRKFISEGVVKKVISLVFVVFLRGMFAIDCYWWSTIAAASAPQ